ncbi:MAG: hypothetical protein HY457_00965 [Parcubacteria group bacterium]|nr:hypothetical protein [Parcubacteria group bacterium]
MVTFKDLSVGDSFTLPRSNGRPWTKISRGKARLQRVLELCPPVYRDLSQETKVIPSRGICNSRIANRTFVGLEIGELFVFRSGERRGPVTKHRVMKKVDGARAKYVLGNDRLGRIRTLRGKPIAVKPRKRVLAVDPPQLHMYHVSERP